MKLWEYEEKQVRITTEDGMTYEGKADDYTSALDNEPNGACIYIGDIEFLESEIEKIELLED